MTEEYIKDRMDRLFTEQMILWDEDEGIDQATGDAFMKQLKEATGGRNATQLLEEFSQELAEDYEGLLTILCEHGYDLAEDEKTENMKEEGF